jgi:hypothetical protein
MQLHAQSPYHRNCMQLHAQSLPQASAAGAPGAAARAELGLEDDYYSTSVGQRERMLAATERLNKTGNRINQGQQQLLETEVRKPMVLACT